MNPARASRLQRCETQLRDFLDQALRGVAVETILEPAAPGKWSAHENLAHLARYHEIFLERITRMLNENKPLIDRYRAEEDPQWESWRARSYKEVAAELTALREKVMSRLKSLSDEDYERAGIHPKLGEMSLALWLEFFLVHEAHHLYVVLGQVRNQSRG